MNFDITPDSRHLSSLVTPIQKSNFSPLKSIQSSSKHDFSTSLKNGSKQSSRYG